MKKTLAFVSLMVFALACAAPPTNDSAANANRATNAATERPPVVMTEADAIAKEKAIWETSRLRRLCQCGIRFKRSARLPPDKAASLRRKGLEAYRVF